MASSMIFMLGSMGLGRPRLAFLRPNTQDLTPGLLQGGTRDLPLAEVGSEYPVARHFVCYPEKHMACHR